MGRTFDDYPGLQPNVYLFDPKSLQNYQRNCWNDKSNKKIHPSSVNWIVNISDWFHHQFGFNNTDSAVFIFLPSMLTKYRNCVKEGKEGNNHNQ